MKKQELYRVRELIRKIEDKADDGDCFRGEDRDYDKVSSGFYRTYIADTSLNQINQIFGSGIMGNFVDLLFTEKVVREAMSWEKEQQNNDPAQTISMLQHYRGKTNVIDFTKDPLIALYFSCDGAHSNDGRIIILKPSDVDGAVWEPTIPLRRVTAQKSVFVQPQKGFFVPSKTIPVPKEDKKSMLSYLKEKHGIDKEYIYGDLHGFVDHQISHKEEVRDGVLEKLVEFFDEHIKNNPSRKAEGLSSRGVIYILLRKLDEAIGDFDESIRIKPTADAYHNRAIAYYRKDNNLIRQAVEDLGEAIRLNPLYKSHLIRGSFYLLLNDPANATEDFTVVIKDHPPGVDLSAIYSYRASAYAIMGNVDKALRDISEAQKVDPKQFPI